MSPACADAERMKIYIPLLLPCAEWKRKKCTNVDCAVGVWKH
jgi:hypothetical protein